MLRIIGGKYSGVKLVTPKRSNTRPTTDMIRESIFNLLQSFSFDQPILDLYAGSGALGIEAFSRFQEEVYLVDRSFEAIQAIKQNLAKLHHDEFFHILKMDAKKALLKFEDQGISFSLIFLDPPYRYQNQNDDVRQIIDLKLVRSGTIFVCQGDLNLPAGDFPELSLLKSKKYGKTLIYIYQVE